MPCHLAVAFQKPLRAVPSPQNTGALTCTPGNSRRPDEGLSCIRPGEGGGSTVPVATAGLVVPHACHNGQAVFPESRPRAYGSLRDHNCGDLVGDLLDGAVRRAQDNPIGKGRAAADDLVLRRAVPEREEYLTSRDGRRRKRFM